MKNKKVLIIGLVLLVLVGGGVLAATKMGKKSAEEATQEDGKKKKKKITEPLNVIDAAERPYIQLAPLADGRNIIIIVKNVKKEATDADYELEYQAGELLQGAFGNIELATVPANKQIMFGSCSAGGACTYHSNIKGGKLLIRFNGPENYALRQEWKYFDNKAGESQFSSKDAKFQLSSKDLGKQRFIIIYNSPGYAEGLENKTVVSEPYSLAASATLKGTADLTMRATEEGDLMIMGYDGKKWTEFESEADGKTVTGEVDLMEMYVVVKK